MNGLGMVDAIEEGKIVHVSEEYARREGLLILRNFSGSEEQIQSRTSAKSTPRRSWKQTQDLSQFEPFRRPIRISDNDILASLKDNFHWIVRGERQKKHLTRKQTAQSLQVSEHDLKILENGVLPTADYVLVSKIEQFFGISLRKNNEQYKAPLISSVSSEQNSRKKDVSFIHSENENKNSSEEVSLFGEEIEILDEE